MHVYKNIIVLIFFPDNIRLDPKCVCVCTLDDRIYLVPFLPLVDLLPRLGIQGHVTLNGGFVCRRSYKSSLIFNLSFVGEWL